MHSTDPFQPCTAITVQYDVTSNSFGRQAQYFGQFLCMSQEDFDVILDGKKLQMGNHKPQDPQGILAQVGLVNKLRELLQLSLLSQPELAEVEKFALCQGGWPNPCHSGTSLVHQVCITWPTSQPKPSMRHLRTHSMTITMTYKNVAESNCIPC